MDNTYYRYTPKESEMLQSMWNGGVPTDEIAHAMRRSKTALMLQVNKLRKRGTYMIGFADRFAAVKEYKFHQQREREIAKLENPSGPEPESAVPTPATETPSSANAPVRPGWTVKTILIKEGSEKATWETDLTDIVDYGLTLARFIALITNSPYKEEHD